MWKGQIPSHHRLGYTKRKITLCYSTNTAFFSLLRLLLIIVMQGSLIRAAAHQATEGKGWLVEVSACYHCQFRILFFFFPSEVWWSQFTAAGWCFPRSADDWKQRRGRRFFSSSLTHNQRVTSSALKAKYMHWPKASVTGENKFKLETIDISSF